jgi:ribonuclease H / adenosylcobalamin/alpha-ribazole phosphatase
VSAVIVRCDGGARGNPGPAGIGVSITTPRGRVLAEIAEPLGVATNNVAEYTAVLRGVERAAELGAQDVSVISDSKLLIEQLNGNYRVKKPTLQRLHEQVRAAAKVFRTVTYQHVPREKNRRADELVNRAIDEWLAENPDAEVPQRTRQEGLFE